MQNVIFKASKEPNTNMLHTNKIKFSIFYFIYKNRKHWDRRESNEPLSTLSLTIPSVQGEAAVSFLHSALVWLDRIVLGRRRTGLGTGFISSLIPREGKQAVK